MSRYINNKRDSVTPSPVPLEKVPEMSVVRSSTVEQLAKDQLADQSPPHINLDQVLDNTILKQKIIISPKAFLYVENDAFQKKSGHSSVACETPDVVLNSMKKAKRGSNDAYAHSIQVKN